MIDDRKDSYDKTKLSLSSVISKISVNLVQILVIYPKNAIEMVYRGKWAGKW
jgi:hypothetical protein